MKILRHALLLAVFVPEIANAAFPAGQWKAIFYSETVGGTGTEGICIVEVVPGVSGTWYSTIFPAWSGNWFRRGNDIHLHGNFSDGVFSSAWELTRINTRLLTGYSQEWKNDGSFNNYFTTRFDLLKLTCDPPA
jgi:hypothetical protein